MSKELNILDFTVDIVEVATETVQLDDLSLALVGGGEVIVAI